MAAIARGTFTHIHFVQILQLFPDHEALQILHALLISIGLLQHTLNEAALEDHELVTVVVASITCLWPSS